jgi:hypothetical protein
MDSLKILSPTYRLDLTTSPSAALQLITNTPTRAFRVAILNTGTGTAAITFGTTDSNMATPAIAASGSSGAYILAPSMFLPVIIDCGAPNVFIKAISSGTNSLYLTLVANE